MSNPLEPVWKWYRVIQDTLRVSLRVMKKPTLSDAITHRHVFFGLATADAIEKIREAQDELDNMAVVAMVAVFERAIRDYVLAQVIPLFSPLDELRLALKEQIASDIDFWQLSPILIDKVFKAKVDGDLCGMVKQIVEYRNRVAHGHVKGAKPPKFANASAVFERLSRFLRESGVL